MGSLSIANGAGGRVAILNGADGDVIVDLDANAAEWWAAQHLFGAIQLRGGDTGAAARTWREFAGFGESVKPRNMDIKIVGTGPARQLITTQNGVTVFGLYEAAAEALGLQMIDAVRKARGLEPAAVDHWRKVSGYGDA